ncbi:MAG: hypothetical protein RL103_1257 [Pseudomonadota bacterium]
MKSDICSAKQNTLMRECLGAFVVLSLSFSASANPVVYRCGQEITNQPTDPQLCQPLNISQPTQIEGTRVQTSSQQVTRTGGTGASDVVEAAKPPASGVPTGTSAESQERKAKARTILEDEWQKLSAQYAELVQQYNRGKPPLQSGETMHQSSDQQRVTALKTQVQRVERDLQALQRELSRYGVHMAIPLNPATQK